RGETGDSGRWLFDKRPPPHADCPAEPERCPDCDTPKGRGPVRSWPRDRSRLILSGRRAAPRLDPMRTELRGKRFARLLPCGLRRSLRRARRGRTLRDSTRSEPEEIRRVVELSPLASPRPHL